MSRFAPDDFAMHRPGPMSVLFVCQVGFAAAWFWGWLAVLVLRGDPVSGWHIAASTGAITFTLTSVALGARHAIQSNAAVRHEQISRALADISWNSFAQSARSQRDGSARSQRDGEANLSHLEADVVALPRRSRPRPRR